MTHVTTIEIRGDKLVGVCTCGRLTEPFPITDRRRVETSNQIHRANAKVQEL